MLKVDEFNINSAPLQRKYDRFARFMLKVDKLLGSVSPARKDPVWKYLESNTLEDPESIRVALRKSPLTVKHYDAVRSFCDTFTDFKCQQYNPHKTREYLRISFQQIHADWRAAELPTFFSYDWLIRYLLQKTNSPLLVYLKPKTSKRRAKKYSVMITQLLARDRKCCPPMSGYHFPNDESQIENHHDL